MLNRIRLQPILIGILFAIAATLRFLAAQGELWFDEVWSILLVQQNVKSPLDILTRLKHDNNHFLNSFWIFILPPDSSDFLYRLFAVVTGTLSLICATTLSSVRGWTTMFTVAACCSSSYLMVHYSSEARGYAPLMLFTFLSYLAWESSRKGRGWYWELVYAVSTCCGFLSHVAFLQFFAPAMLLNLWSLLFKPQMPRSRGNLIFSLLCRVLIPVSCFMVIWWWNLRGMTVGGGNESLYLDVVLQTLSLSIGGPMSGTLMFLAAGLGILLFLCVAQHLFLSDLQTGLLFLGTTILMPALLLIVMGRNDIYPRYFLVGILLFQWGLGDWLGSLLHSRNGQGSPQLQKWGGALLGFFLLANLAGDWTLIRDKRGHYIDALSWMIDHSSSKQITLAVDHPFRQGLMLGYYLPRTPGHERIQAFNTSIAGPPEWFLLHQQSPEPPPRESIGDPTAELHIDKVFPSVKLSGWDLVLYQRRHKSNPNR